MPLLHIANTFFEHELSTNQPRDVSDAMRRNLAYLQLQFLPCLYANPHDAVVVSDLPDPNYPITLHHWKLPALTLHRFEENKIPTYEHIESWGASQAIDLWAKHHRQSYTIPEWNIVKEINSKSFSFQHSPRLPHATLLHNKEDTIEWLHSFSGPKILKTCFGLSGTGHQLIESSTPLEKIFSFLHEEWKSARPVLAEPWVTRILDFSTQWTISPNLTITYLGATKCINNARGKYVANQIGEETRLFGTHITFLEQHKTIVHKLLIHLAQLGYFGNVGCDAMIYQDQHGPTLHPVVEINARKTMGYASLLFQQKHFPGKTLTFRFAQGEKGLLPSSLQLKSGKHVVFKRNLQVEIEN